MCQNTFGWPVEHSRANLLDVKLVMLTLLIEGQQKTELIVKHYFT